MEPDGVLIYIVCMSFHKDKLGDKIGFGSINLRNNNNWALMLMNWSTVENNLTRDCVFSFWLAWLLHKRWRSCSFKAKIMVQWRPNLCLSSVVVTWLRPVLLQVCDCDCNLPPAFKSGVSWFGAVGGGMSVHDLLQVCTATNSNHWMYSMYSMYMLKKLNDYRE